MFTFLQFKLIIIFILKTHLIYTNEKGVFFEFKTLKFN